MDVSSAAPVLGTPSQGQRRSVDASSNAWRYRLEQEAKSALQAFRAVDARGIASGAQGVNAPDGKVRAAATPWRSPTASRPAVARGPGPSTVAQPAAPTPWQAARAYAAQAFNPLGVQGSADRKLLQPEPAGSVSNDMHQSAAVLRACLAGGNAHWPWRKLHLVLEEGGVRAWLRDSGMVEGGPDLAAMLRHLQDTLAGLGMRLLGFTLNGKPLALA